MPVGNSGSRKVYYKLMENEKKDRLNIGMKGLEESYSYIQGKVKELKAIKGEYNGETTLALQVVFSAGDYDEVLQVGGNSLAARDIILSLVNLSYLECMRLTPYLSEYEGKNLKRISVRIADNLPKLDSKDATISSKPTDAKFIQKDKIYKADKSVIPIRYVQVGKKQVVDEDSFPDFIQFVADLSSRLIKSFNPNVPTHQEDYTPEVVDEEDVPF